MPAAFFLAPLSEQQVQRAGAAIAGLGVVDSDDSSPIGRLIEPRRHRAAQHTVALIGAALAGDHQDPALAGRLGIAD